MTEKDKNQEEESKQVIRVKIKAYDHNTVKNYLLLV